MHEAGKLVPVLDMVGGTANQGLKDLGKVPGIVVHLAFSTMERIGSSCGCVTTNLLLPRFDLIRKFLFFRFLFHPAVSPPQSQ